MFFKKSGPHGEYLRWAPEGTPGVFAGYRIAFGYNFRGERVVWPMEVFKSTDFRVSSMYTDQELPEPLVIKVVRLPTEGLQFPLKADYDRCNLEPREVEGEELPPPPDIPAANPNRFHRLAENAEFDLQEEPEQPPPEVAPPRPEELHLVRSQL